MQGRPRRPTNPRAVSGATRTRPLATRGVIALLAILLLGVGAALLTPLLTYPMGRDQGVFATLADVIAAGGAPYRDAWDVKPPGIFYVFWVSFQLFGRSEMAPRLMDLLWTLATGVAIWALGRRLLSSWAGVAAGLLFVLRYVTHDYYWHTTQCDGFASLPLALAALALLAAERKKSAPWAAATGALTALAITFKFTLGIFLALPLAGVAASSEEPLRPRLSRAAAYLSGCVGVLLLIAGLIWQAGAFKDMVETVFVWNSHYARLHVPGMLQHNALAEIARFLVGNPNRLLFPIGLLAVAGAVDLISRPDSGRMRWLVPAWMLAMIAQVWVQGRYYSYHWLPALPPMALLAGQGLRTAAFLLGKASGGRAARAMSAAGLVIVFGFLGFAYWHFLRAPIGCVLGRLPRETYLRGFDRAIRSDFSLLDDREMAGWIRDHTAQNEPIFIWGFEPLVYFLADRPPASRFIYTIPLVASWSPPEWRAELLRELQERRPPYILVVRDDAQPWMTGRWDDSAAQLETYPELQLLLREHYRPGEQIGDFAVLERRPVADEDPTTTGDGGGSAANERR